MQTHHPDTHSTNIAAAIDALSTLHGGDNGKSRLNKSGSGRYILVGLLLAVLGLCVLFNSGVKLRESPSDASGASGSAVSSSSVTPYVPSADDAKVAILPPWGYNKERNIPRAKAILNSIALDVSGSSRFDKSGGHFTVVDYGSDQGYFSISVTKSFPKSLAMGLEMGGVGGEIWKKADSQDVLSIQESKISKYAVTNNMRICQTKVLPEHFFELKKQQLVSDYQFVLSVFHWFDLPTRKDFEETIAALFLNARTTFIELPVIGDNGATIRGQVGWKNFVKWYDGRTDMEKIIIDSAESQGLKVNVNLVASVPWIKWTRDTYRVDVISVKGADAPPAVNFGCAERRKIYACAQRELYSGC